MFIQCDNSLKLTVQDIISFALSFICFFSLYTHVALNQKASTITVRSTYPGGVLEIDPEKVPTGLVLAVKTCKKTGQNEHEDSHHPIADC